MKFRSLFLLTLSVLWGCSNNDTAGGATEATNGIAKDTIYIVHRDTLDIFHRDTLEISHRDTVIFRDTLWTNTPHEVAVEKVQLSGAVQKGPFVGGSAVTLWELKPDGVTMSGRGFRTHINSKGEFVIHADSLVSKYVVIEGTGYYRNEITGESSATELSLNAIVDVSSKKNVNLNLLTQLEYERVLHLVQSENMTVESAKKQAITEIGKIALGDGLVEDFSALDIFGSETDDGRLLALSVMMLNYKNGMELADYLSKVSEQINEVEDIADVNVRQKLVNNMKRYPVSPITVKKNMAEWEEAFVSEAFDNEINNVIGNAYTEKFGLCSESNEGEGKVDDDTGSATRGDLFICRKGRWVYSYLNPTYPYEVFVDGRDNNVYRATVIGTQTWMAENLRYRADVDGIGCYNDDESYCEKYGAYYSTEAAITSCPAGWHLPTEAEWITLFKTVDGESYDINKVGSKLKAIKGWDKAANPDMETPTDLYGFAALPGGVVVFGDEGHTGFYSSSTKTDPSNYFDFGISDNSALTSEVFGHVLISARCVKD